MDEILKMITLRKPYIIDIEASGFGSHSYPVEIGVITPDEHRYCWLIRPEEQWTHWDSNAESIHHISRQQLLKSGRSVGEAARSLNALLLNHTVYSDAWVVDSPWLTSLFTASGIGMQFKISPIESLMSEWQIEQWDAVKTQLAGTIGVTRHRASNDAYLIQQTYCALFDACNNTMKRAG